MPLRKTSTWFEMLGLLLALAAFGPSAAADFLELEQAFQFSIQRADHSEVAVAWKVADGYHLYSERISVTTEPANLPIGKSSLPAGKRQFDIALNREVEVLDGDVTLRVPLDGAQKPTALLISSQGCAEAGLCYPPQQVRVALNAAPVQGPSATPVLNAVPVDENNTIDQLFRGGNRFKIAIGFLVFGLLLSFTPCVLPMVPILSSIIVGEQQTPSKSRGLALAAAYSLGMATIYTTLGVAAGIAGEGLAAQLQKPAVLLGFATLLVALALSMFDVYQLQLPNALQSRLNNTSNRLQAGRFSGVFIMGAISAMIVGPCVAAPLASALVYISQTKDVVTGGIALFAMACGMSVPLLLTGLSAGSLLPRAGAWMNSVKRFFGVMLLATALWMASPALPSWLQMLGWAALLIGSAIGLGALEALGPTPTDGRALRKAAGVMLLIIGTLELLGALSGGRDSLQPLQHLANKRGGGGAIAQAGAVESEALFRKVKSEDVVTAAARSGDKPVLLDLYADWCTACKEMDLMTYSDPAVRTALQGFTALKVDVTKNTESDRALMKQFGVFGPPGLLAFDRNGTELRAARTIGFVAAPALLAKLQLVSAKH